MIIFSIYLLKEQLFRMSGFTSRQVFRNTANQALNTTSNYSERPQSNQKYKKSMQSITSFDSLQIFQTQINAAMKTQNLKKKREIQNKNNKTKASFEIEQKKLKSLVDKMSKMFDSNQSENIPQQNSPFNNYNYPMMYPPMPMNMPYYPPMPYPQYPQYPPYPPYQYPNYPPPQYPHYSNKQLPPEQNSPTPRKQRVSMTPRESYSIPKKIQKPKQIEKQTKPKINAAKKLRVAFYVVTFIQVFKSYVKKTVAVHKSVSKQFLQQQFAPQINHLKNWLLQSQKYTLPLILQKKAVQLFFVKTAAGVERDSKKKLIMKIVELGISSILDISTTFQIAPFSKLLAHLCMNCSFPKDNFWSPVQMDRLSISQKFGFLRLTPNLQKFMVGIFVLIKVFLFNLYLQPWKFDSQNFSKQDQLLKNNMKMISSVFYQMFKQVIESYSQQSENKQFYYYGNWIQIESDNFVSCCEPLRYGQCYPKDQQYIYGLEDWGDIKQIKGSSYWASCISKIKTIVQELHFEANLKMNKIKLQIKSKVLQNF